MDRVKQLFSVFIAVIVLFDVFGAGIGRAPDGRIQVENLKLSLQVILADGTSVEQHQPGVLTFPGEAAEKTEQGLRRYGKFKLTDTAVFDLTETVKRISDCESSFRYVLSTRGESPTRLFSLALRIPLADYQQRPLLIDGVSRHFSDRLKEIHARGTRYQLPLETGILELEVPISRQVMIIPGSTVLIRIVFGYSRKKHANLDVVMRYRSYQAQPVDLRRAMNMGFADEVAEDGKGGWTDQGADNDLSMMKTGLHELSGIPFRIVDPVANDGKSCIAMRGKARPDFCKSARVSVPDFTGRTLFLLNGLAWAPPREKPVGKVTVAYADGQKQEYILRCGIDTGNFWKPYRLENAEVVWQAQNRAAPVGLYATRIPLEPKPVIGLEFTSMNQVWMIVGATIGTVAPHVVDSSTVIRRGEDWVPLASRFDTVKGSAADLSGLLDAPAGKYGFVTAVGDHFEFTGRPGVPVRFWGCNLCSGSQYDSEEVTRKMLDNIAGCGYNAIRLHHFDNSLVTRRNLHRDEINPQQMGKLDFLLSEAKKRGIYVTLDLFTLRWWAKIPKYGELRRGDYKLLCYFDEDVRRDLIRISKDLLSHKNPYTGLCWADDPAVVFINLVNEGTLSTLVPRANARCKAAINTAFGKYLTARKLADTPQNRKTHYTAFLNFTGREFFNTLKQELASIGVRIPLCDQNFDEPAGDIRHHYDYVDTHFYWCHPVAIGKEADGLPAYIAAGSAIASNAGGLRHVFHVPISGKPMVISEWNFCYPNPYLFEGALLTGAYAALQDYSGLMQFYYAGRRGEEQPRPLESFLISANPLQKLAARCGAFFFLRGDVAPSGKTVLMTEKAAPRIGSRLPLVSKVRRYSTAAPAGIPVIAAPEEMTVFPGRNVIRRRSDDIFFAELRRAGAVPEYETGRSGSPVISSTGEIELDSAKRSLKVRTARSEALVVSPGERSAGRFLRIENGQAPAAFFTASLDNRSLTDSRRILLLHLTDVKSENTVFSDKEMTVLKDIGSRQLLLRRNKAVAELRLNRPCRIFACEYTGERRFEVPVARKAGNCLVTLDNSVGGQGIMLYEVVAE